MSPLGARDFVYCFYYFCNYFQAEPVGAAFVCVCVFMCERARERESVTEREREGLYQSWLTHMWGQPSTFEV